MNSNILKRCLNIPFRGLIMGCECYWSGEVMLIG